MSKNLLSVFGLLLGLVLFLAVNLLGQNVLAGWRADLTANNLYTLSDGTRNILRSLEDPVTLRLYFSKELAGDYPHLETYFERVRDLLAEYDSEGGDSLDVEIIEPEPFSEEEDRAVAFGLSGPRVGATGESLYFGLAGTNSVDEELVIPFFDTRREEFLEYDLTEMVYNLSNFERRIVGVYSSLPLRGVTPDLRQRPQPWAIVQQLEQLFEVKWLNDEQLGNDGVPEDVDVMLVVHPKDATPDALFAIDQYVLGGGRLLAFVDPHCEVDPGGPEAQQNPMMAKRASDLGPLLGAWGLELEAGKLAADMDAAERVNWTSGPIDFPVWMRLTSDNLSEEDFVASGLSTVTVRSAGVLKTLGEVGTTVEPILSTGTNAMTIEAMQMQFAPDPARILDNFIAGGLPLTLAARVTGSVKSAYPDGRPSGPPPSEYDEEAGDNQPTPEWLTESEGPIQVVVAADADMLHEGAWARIQNFLGSMMIIPNADNGDLLSNALDNLSGSDDLISLRSRGRFQRPFDKKIELEREADQRFRAKEQELEAKLAETEKQLNELQQDKEGSSSLILSPEQSQAIERFREEQVATRKELREVKHQLRKDIESLGTRLKFANILGMPLVVLLAALGSMILRSKRRS